MTDKISLKDIDALKSVLSLTKKFFEKILIKKRKFNFKRIENKLEQLRENIEGNKPKIFNKYVKLVKKIRDGIQNEISSQIFFIFGHHGGIIINDIGFCEFDLPKYASDKLLERMDLALENNMSLNLEIAVSCLEKLFNDYPEEFSKFREKFLKGRFQIINPSYSLPYNLIIGSESNIKQIEFGLKILDRMGLNCNFYYASESSVHPQLPQILKKFEIDYASLRSRLLGMNPTTISANIEWTGLDNTKIQAIINQAGLFTGEYFHGTFFQEIPNLLFQSVSFPFNDYILYSNIEDFVLSLPYQEEIWNVSKHNDVFGKFVLCSEFLRLTEKSGTFKFNRDSFYLGDNLFLEQKLFYHNKSCETLLISLEIINSMFNIGHSIEIEDNIQQLWKNLLITQTHDSYAVPFLHSGDYFFQQLGKKELEKLQINRGEISISELCIQIQKRLEKKAKELIYSILDSYLKKLSSKKNQIPCYLFIVNPSPFFKKDLVSIPWNFKKGIEFNLQNQKNKSISCDIKESQLEFIAEIPPVGFQIYELKPFESIPLKDQSNNYFYSVTILPSKKTIEIKFKNKCIYKMEFKSQNPYNLSLINHIETNIKKKYVIKCKFKNKEFVIEILQYTGINRLEFCVDAKTINEIIIKPNFKFSETFINYPFGVEKTERASIQTLDFLLVKNDYESLLYIQKNSQKFKIDHFSSEISNEIKREGLYEFAIMFSDGMDIKDAYSLSRSYFYNLFGIPLYDYQNLFEKSNSYISIENSIIENVWTRKDNQFVRLFNPSEKLKHVKLSGSLIVEPVKEVNLRYKELRTINSEDFKMRPWEIKTIKIKRSKQN